MDKIQKIITIKENIFLKIFEKGNFDLKLMILLNVVFELIISKYKIREIKDGKQL